MWVQPDGTFDQFGAEDGDFFGERRQGRSRRGQILIPVPGAGNAAVDDFTFSQGAVLMTTDVGKRGDAAVVLKDGDTFSAQRDNLCVTVGYGIGRTGEHEIAPDLFMRREIYFSLAECGGQLQSKDDYKTARQRSCEQRRLLRLQKSQSDMRNEQGVSEIHQHVQRLPHGWGEVTQPEVMAGSGHQEQDNERDESKRLKREVGEAAVIAIGKQEADQRVGITERMKLKDRKRAVNQAQKKRRRSKVPAIVEQRKKAGIESAQRTDAKDYRKQKESRGAAAADNQRFRGGGGMKQDTEADESSEINHDASNEDGIVPTILRIPANGGVLVAHWVESP